MKVFLIFLLVIVLAVAAGMLARELVDFWRAAFP